MRLRHSMSCIACGLPLLTLAGCYSPPPYGSTGYPGYYSQPGGMGGAPQMGGPQLGSPGSPPTLVNPGGSSVAPGPSSSQGWQQPSTSPQTWDPKDQNSSKVVPNADRLEIPSLDSPKSRTEEVPPFEEKDAPQRSPGNGASLPQNRFGRVATNVDSKPQDFQPPIDVTPASSKRPSVQLASAETSSGPSPYAFDGDNYRFLRGVVEYDVKDKAWHVMYSAEPDSHDKFGGDISLIDHPQLKGLRDQDVVYIEGHVDPQKRDSHGKPCYRIDHMRKLVPKSAA